MQKRLGTLFLCIAAVVALFAMSAVPALAGEDNKGQEKKEEKAHNYQQADQQASDTSDNDGDADSDSSTAYTEDNDTNDGTANNVSDEGDNAHPSGKDRSVEHGKSGNQGKAESNPDDSKGPMRYEGAQGDDKPNGPGGTDLADQDGNNGCGNDDDFNDDNNGWCGPRVKPTPAPTTTPVPTCPNGSAMPANGKCGTDDVVKGDKLCPAGTDMAGQKPGATGCNTPDEVKPNEYTRCPAGTENAGFPMTDLADCDDDDVLGRTDEVNPLDVCPSGPFAGMPMTDEADCGFGDRVLPKVIHNEANPTVAGKVAGAVGAVLPFTGAGDLYFSIALAMLLIAAGAVALKLRKAA